MSNSKPDKSADNASNDDEVNEETLKDFLYIVAKIIASEDSDESQNAEIEKLVEEFQKKHPDAEKLWESFVNSIDEIDDSSEESSGSTKSKRSETVARFNRQANNLNELRNLF